MTLCKTLRFIPRCLINHGITCFPVVVKMYIEFKGLRLQQLEDD